MATKKKPPRFTNAKRDEFLGHIRQGMRPGAAAEAMGFDRDRILDQIADEEKFSELVAKAEREANEHVEEALYQAAVSGNITACRMWLDLRKPKTTTMVVAGGDPAEEPEFDKELAELNAIAAGE